MNFNIDFENINYVKIHYKDSENFTHCIKTAVKRIGEKDIFLCVKNEEDLFIPYPQEVELGVACDNGLYKAKTTLKSVQNDGFFLFLDVNIPKNVEYKQDREFFRVKYDADAIVYYLKDNKTEQLKTNTYDMSANGIRLVTNEIIDFSEDVQITIIFSNREVHALAKFVRYDDDDKIMKSSFNFVEISSSDADYISQICFQVQLKEKRKNKFS